MAAAGIVTYAPFRFAGAAHTDEVEEIVGHSLIWIETEHFRLGMNLEEYKLPGDREEKRRIRDELKELKRALPDVNSKARSLDPWLRAHLYAQRLETLYADFCAAFAIDEADFPDAKSWESAEPFQGRGPYLGMPEKFCVLLTQKDSSLGRFTQHTIKRSSRTPQRWSFWDQGSLFYGSSWAFQTGPYGNESGLQVSVVYGVTQNLVDSYRYFSNEKPLWLREGFGHAFARQVDERRSTIHAAKDARFLTEEDQEWARKTRARVQYGLYPKFADMLTWSDTSKLDLNEQRMIWSRADFLLARDEPQALGAFLYLIAEPRPYTDDPEVERAALVECQHRALEEAFGWTPEDFDREWESYVLEEYPKR